MLGNVYEWCSNSPNGTLPSTTDEIDSASADRVFRGGSWVSDARSVRAACRNWHSPDLQGSNLGFRCRVRENDDEPAAETKKIIIGCPWEEMEIAVELANRIAEHNRPTREILCDSIPKLNTVSARLDKIPPLYDGLILMMTRDFDWVDECTTWLSDLEEKYRGKQDDSLPKFRAVLHNAASMKQRVPMPVSMRTADFKEFFTGKNGENLNELVQELFAELFNNNA